MQTEADQAELVRWLAAPGTLGPEAATRIDTHISRVFLSGERVYKLKRAVALPYVDFSTLEKRRLACEAEWRVNRRTAPGLYLSVEAIRRDARGRWSLGGAGEAVDWLVVMRRFDQDALLDRMAETGRLDIGTVVRAAEIVARFHEAAERVATADGASRVAEVIAGNAESERRFAVPWALAQEAADALTQTCAAALRRLSPLLDARAAAGRIRDGHGDLHLRNICVIEGVPVPFDAIEFNPEWRRIDVWYDVAFLLMDLLHRDLPRHANAALNAYLGAGGGGADGLAALPLFLALRAIVRGHVAAAAQGARAAAARDPAEARAYFELARRCLAPAQPRLVWIGGLSGTGKSTAAREIAPCLAPPPGAVVLRSDAIRKRLAGRPETARLPEEFYGADWTRRVFAEIERQAAEAVAAGSSVVVDAVGARGEHLRPIHDLAARLGLPFRPFWLEAPLAVREARVSARRDDASDADVAIVRRQEERPEPPAQDWVRIDASGSPAETLARIAARLP